MPRGAWERQLVETATQAIRVDNNLSSFWEYVGRERRAGRLQIPDSFIQRILRMNDATIYKVGQQLREKDHSDWTRIIEMTSYGSGCAEEGQFSNSQFAVIMTRLQQQATKISSRPELSPEAMKRSEQLVRDVTLRFGWRYDNGFFVHDYLGLLFSSKSLTLRVMDKGMPAP